MLRPRHIPNLSLIFIVCGHAGKVHLCRVLTFDSYKKLLPFLPLSLSRYAGYTFAQRAMTTSTHLGSMLHALRPIAHAIAVARQTEMPLAGQAGRENQRRVSATLSSSLSITECPVGTYAQLHAATPANWQLIRGKWGSRSPDSIFWPHSRPLQTADPLLQH